LSVIPHSSEDVIVRKQCRCIHVRCSHFGWNLGSFASRCLHACKLAKQAFTGLMWNKLSATRSIFQYGRRSER